MIEILAVFVVCLLTGIVIELGMISDRLTDIARELRAARLDRKDRQ